MKPDIVELAATSGFDLRPAEVALLRGLAEKGNFEGSDYRKNVEGVDVSDELSNWLPSVWNSDVYNQPPDPDPWLASEQMYRNHERLYAEAPFPIVSGALLEWLLSSEAVNYLRSIYLTNIKVAGDLSATHCKVEIKVLFTQCVFQSRCSLSGRIGRQLGFTGVYAHYISISGEYPEGITFNDVHCRGFAGRSGGALFLNAVTSPRLFVYGMFVPNRVAIRDCKITDVKIIGRVLAGDLHIDRSEMQDLVVTRGDASYFTPYFSASGITVARSCVLGNLRGISISHATIGENFVVENIAPSNDSKKHLHTQNIGLQLCNVEIKGMLKVDLGPLARKEHLRDRRIRLSFDNVTTHLYQDNRQDLEAIEQLELEGLKYQELGRWDTAEVNDRIQWLTLQPSKPFPLGSWHRLAAQFRRQRRSREARTLLIESERRRREAQDPSASARFWSWLLRISIGYGWELWRIGFLAVPVVLLGSIVAWWGMKNCLMSQTGEVSARVSFNPLVYSLDSALPIIELGHASLWIPKGEGLGGRLVQIYFWIHTILGWIIGTLFVAGFTGVAHKTSDE